LREALANGSRALSIFDRLENRRAGAQAAAAMGIAYEALDQTSQARQSLERARAAYEELGSPDLQLVNEVLERLQTA
jgi:hypothetical protein